MSKRRYDLLEIMKRKISMASRLVSEKTEEYGDLALYSGADLATADKMAKIDTILKLGIIPKEYVPFFKLYRIYLNQRRLAFFASVSSEITKLGLMLGLKDDRIKATKS